MEIPSFLPGECWMQKLQSEATNYSTYIPVLTRTLLKETVVIRFLLPQCIPWNQSLLGFTPCFIPKPALKWRQGATRQGTSRAFPYLSGQKWPSSILSVDLVTVEWIQWQSEGLPDSVVLPKWAYQDTRQDRAEITPHELAWQPWSISDWP